MLKIKEEVIKQYNAGFLLVSHYPEWLANIVPVPKKDGKVRMCIDFRNLNKASPKDDFPFIRGQLLIERPEITIQMNELIVARSMSIFRVSIL